MEQNDSEIGQQSREVDITTTRVRRPCKQTMKKLVVFIASIIILVAGVLICYGYTKYKHSELKRTVPISILQSVDFPIYVPVNHTTKVDNKSFDYTNGVLQFTVQNTAEQLHFSEQKKTPEFDISKFAGGIQISGVNN